MTLGVSKAAVLHAFGAEVVVFAQRTAVAILLGVFSHTSCAKQLICICLLSLELVLLL